MTTPAWVLMLLVCGVFWLALFLMLQVVLRLGPLLWRAWRRERRAPPDPRQACRVRRRLLACGSVEVRELYPTTDLEEVRSILPPLQAQDLVGNYLAERYRVVDEGWDCPEVEALPLEG